MGTEGQKRGSKTGVFGGPKNGGFFGHGFLRRRECDDIG